MISAAKSLESFILFTTLTTLLTKQVSGELPTRPNYFSFRCYNANGNYTENSPFQNNLNLVLSDLKSNASAGLPFYSSSSDGVYGIYHCRGDISAHLCSDCVNAATRNVTGACFKIKEVVVWYQECTVQSSSSSKVGIEEEYPFSSWVSPANVSDPPKFLQVLTSNVKNITQKAAYGNGSKGFATGKEDVTLIETLYSLVQCRPDINASFCDSCLKAAFVLINSVYGGYSANQVYVYYPSCQLRYELSPFYYTPPPTSTTGKGKRKGVWFYIKRICVPLALLLLLICGGWFWCRKRKDEVRDDEQILFSTKRLEEPEIGNVECFHFKTMEDATDNFSDENKLGQGGFGSVYKGILPNGHLIAVKRLSRTCGDRTSEFKTEVAVVAKLQHRNLVRLLGFCVDHEERILVYEFLPNLSLEKILFDETKSVDLDWGARFKIIEGIAWGLRYLHVDSLLTIVHRDLKSSNILLGKEMNPKIADFGLAKLVAVDETTVNVTTIKGTMGYMPPEYFMEGRCTVKSDIYSFGVIILEVLSGKSIGKFIDPISGAGLLNYAWKLWNQGELEELMDPTLQNKYSRTEAERWAQIGLLCVQDDEDRRPTIRVLLSMLENQSIELPNPSTSTFYRNKNPAEPMIAVSQEEPSTSNLYDNDLYPHQGSIYNFK